MKKIMSAMLCCLLAATIAAFTGCSAKDTLTIATNAEFEPFEFMRNSEIVGFDIDLINEIAAKLDKTVKLDNMEFDGVIAAVQSGTSKAAISGLTITPKRAGSVDFSAPYYTGAAQMLIVRGDDSLFLGATKAELDGQLQGRNIGVCAGYTGEAYVNGDEDMGFAGIEGATATVFDNISLAITALKNGSIDAIIMDDSVAKKAAETPENTGVKVVNVALSVEEYGIAMQKGDAELKAQIDQALRELASDGTIGRLLEKWEIE